MNAVNKTYLIRQRNMRRRAIKYILFSLMLTIMLVTATGCTALLLGKNREAYERLEKAADYFKYPSSVRIVSGEMSGDKLYCEIMAKNGFGRYRYETYAISSSGYPYESSSYLCYSSSALNYDAINNALAQRYGSSYSSGSSFSFDYLTGGSGSMILLYIVILIVALCINGLLSSKASDMAQDKGYEKRTWFHMCFWLGLISYIIIAAMPDRTMQRKTDRTNMLLEELLASQKASREMQEHEHREDISTVLPEL